MTTHILITGTNRGIGREHVQQWLAREDTVVHAVTRHPEQMTDLKADNLHVYKLDVTDWETVAALPGKLETNRLHVLINNAAVGGDFSTLDSIEMDRIIDKLRVNVGGPLAVTKALIGHLKEGAKEAGHAKIVNITSGLGSIAEANDRGYYGYNTSKAAINMITKLLAEKLGDDGIIAISVDPGWVKTEMGGPNAQITTEESVRDQIALIERLAPEHSGLALRRTGEKIPY